MGFLEISALAAAVFNTVLAVLVIRADLRSLLHRVYLGFAVSLTVWNVAACFLYAPIPIEEALIWGKVLMAGVLYIPLFMLHVCLVLTDTPRTRMMPVFYALHTFYLCLLPTNLFVAGVQPTPYGYWTVGGPLFYFYLVSHLASIVWLVLVLEAKRKKTPRGQRSAITALLVGVFVLSMCGSNDMLPILGVSEYPFIHVHFFPVGNLASNLYAVLVSYSVLQHELLDVHITLSKAAARLVRLSFVFVIALLLLLLAWMASPKAFTAFSFVISLCVVLASTSIASVLFPRLFGSGGDAIERRILGDRFEYHDRIRGFISSVEGSDNTEQLLDGLHDLLIKVVRVQGYQLSLIRENNRQFAMLREYPKDSGVQIPIMGGDSPLIRYFHTTGASYLAAANLPSEHMGPLEEKARELLAMTGAEFCFPFMVSSDPFGLLFVRGRTEGKRYTATDVSLLASLARSLSLVLNQIRLKNQILQAQESELLGRMSRGMAHDMNNLVTPVQTLMQLMAEGVSIDDLRDELLPVAIRSIDTLREYVREALFFSENSRPDFKLGRLDMVLNEVAHIVRPRCEQKRIQLQVRSLDEALVEMDKSLMKRTVTNILANAIDASPNDSENRIDLSRLESSEKGREWFRIQVEDFGEGIRPEDMPSIFTPYFTTKTRGDERRGFGLGLSICRKVVQLHGGSLQISSQRGKGTTVLIDLPDHQSKTPASNLAPA